MTCLIILLSKRFINAQTMSYMNRLIILNITPLTSKLLCRLLCIIMSSNFVQAMTHITARTALTESSCLMTAGSITLITRLGVQVVGKRLWLALTAYISLYRLLNNIEVITAMGSVRLPSFHENLKRMGLNRQILLERDGNDKNEQNGQEIPSQDGNFHI